MMWKENTRCLYRQGLCMLVHLLLLHVLVVTSADTKPQQVHISSTGIDSGIVVTWITFYSTSSSQVRYALHGNKTLDRSVVGVVSSYKDGDTTRFVHRVTLQDLQPNTKYDYQCGYPSNWSITYQMKTIGNSSNYSPQFLVYGDFGYDNAQSMSLIKRHVNGFQGTVDAILHVGDLAYDLFSDNGSKGDKFMEMIEPVASRVPYMTIPGNHESENNFEEYRKRFSMPGGHDSIYYSWNVGPAHIIMFSTEVYFYLEYGLKPVKDQYEWLVKDLQQATTPEALAQRPWIITMAHRPMYCSTTDNDDCDREKSIVRTGLEFVHLYPLEKLFHQHGVDLCVWAHEHIYERLWPVYDGKVMNGSYDQPYNNPKAPVHIITGSAGCSERHDTFKKDQPDWIAFTSSDYGFTRMTITNKTHLSIEQISDDQKGKIVDSFTIIKTQEYSTPN